MHKQLWTKRHHAFMPNLIQRAEALITDHIQNSHFKLTALVCVCVPLVLTGSGSVVVSSHCPPAAGRSPSRHHRCWGWRLRHDYHSHRFPCQPEQKSDLSCNREQSGFSSRSSVPIATASKHLDTHTHTHTSHTSVRFHMTIKVSSERLTLKSSVS